MKKMTAFFTIALLVCIAICVAFAANQNRDVSHCFLIKDVDDDFPGPFSDEDCTGTDSEGPLYSTGSAWTGYYHENGDLRFGASGYGYVSCYTDNGNYKTTYKLHVKVPAALAFVNERNPEENERRGSFSDSEYVSGEGNGDNFSLGGASGSASASGKNPSNNAQHSTSAAAPTRVTARDIERINP